MRSCLVIVLLLAFSAANSQRGQSVAIKKTIDSLNIVMEKAFNENDMIKVAAFYSDDAEIAGEGYAVKGRKALDNYWLSLKDKGRGWKLTVIEVGGSGEFVFQLGRSDLKYIAGNNPDPVSAVTDFVLIWRLQADGSYRIFRDYLTKTKFETSR